MSMRVAISYIQYETGLGWGVGTGLRSLNELREGVRVMTSDLRTITSPLL